MESVKGRPVTCIKVQKLGQATVSILALMKGFQIIKGEGTLLISYDFIGCLGYYAFKCRSTMLAHKTFHRYTVRAKRGTAQSVRDAHQGGHAPRYICKLV